ncbi:MAG TPA: dihydroorotate dehydrogenase [Gemmatimonadales bacterium]|nr:dihydroorotate dehydrogenase [Gemmatimonadales bacterium]
MSQSLVRTVFGATFQNPILLASGTAGFGRELAGVMDLARLGGLVTKAVSLEPRSGNASPRVAEFHGGMMNSVGLANPGLATVREREMPWLGTSLRGPQVLVNVVGFEEGEYARVIAGLDDLEGFLGYELNLSCPNTSAGGIEFGADPVTVSRIVGSCRAATRRPVIAKLSPALADIAGMAVVARDAGADGVSLVNTMPGYLFNVSGMAPRLGNGNGGVSGPALLPVGVLATRRVLDHTRGELPVIGVGGVTTAADARQYLAAGASLVGIGTAGLADPRVPERVIQGLERGDG